MSSATSAQTCQRFSLEEIISATKTFADERVIGHGGFGKVYKGNIYCGETSHAVAIKRLDSKSNQGEPEFITEIEMLSTLRHCHLVPLIGFCDDNKEMILVYKFMPNGTLYDHLHKTSTYLSWVQRLKIAICVARGLDYLHTGVGTKQGIIHRDVKSSNILLDENWDAMISDFGLSKVSPINQSLSYVDASVKGTFGYLDPEYFYTRKLTRKTDVYAYGVVLFELLTGRRAVDERNGEEQCSLARWAQKCVKERKLDQMVDSKITGTISPKCLRGFAEIADRCLTSVLEKRPTMTQVVAKLQALLEVQKASRVRGLTWKIPKYLFTATKENSAQIFTSTSTNKDLSYNGEISKGVKDLKKFTYCELERAIWDFENDKCLGEGSYGNVYKGWIHKTTFSPCKHNTGLPIAVKRLHHYKYFDPEMLKEFYHPNLVKPIGYCLEGEKLFLVHEFMQKGNLKDLLYSGAVAQLPLVMKVKIAVGIARGIVFLQQTEDGVRSVSESRLHRHNIMLDEDFTAKLSDYDVTQIVNGYYPNNNDFLYDDYYAEFKPLPLRSNLSGFAVVLAEVLTGKHTFYGNEIEKIDSFLLQLGKMSITHIAELCFKNCNELDSESKMLTILEEYEKYIQSGYDKASIATEDRDRFLVGYTLKGHVERVIALKAIDFDQIQQSYSV
uniref:probable LRR receptor-like serine/threonine-protein kinase At4g29180 n=1 Tax=Erigeron canadensis TaxID=72917 RepID=UPI001CB9D17F|nr:probable LRR receptor-like serine/threonine-protein kinase At4g29180 [Erigeron canadensis]